MTFTYDATTTLGLTRLLIGDTASATALFSDEELGAFLTLNGSNARLAAAQALEAMAANQVMVLKVIRLMDLQTDGASVARELRQQAKALRDQVEAGVGDYSGLFDYAELVPNDFAARERLLKQWERGVL